MAKVIQMSSQGDGDQDEGIMKDRGDKNEDEDSQSEVECGRMWKVCEKRRGLVDRTINSTSSISSNHKQLLTRHRRCPIWTAARPSRTRPECSWSLCARLGSGTRDRRSRSRPICCFSRRHDRGTLCGGERTKKSAKAIKADKITSHRRWLNRIGNRQPAHLVLSRKFWTLVRLARPTFWWWTSWTRGRWRVEFGRLANVTHKKLKVNCRLSTPITSLPVLLEEPERTQIGRRLQDDRLVRVLVADGEEKQLDHGAQITQTRLVLAVLVSKMRFAEQSENLKLYLARF